MPPVSNPVRQLWEHMEARRWAEATAQLAPDCVIEWPQTGERFVGRVAFMEMNQAHPAPNWHVREVKTICDESGVACEAVVMSEDGIDVCLGFYDVDEGTIRAGTEYWIRQREQKRPTWREPFSELT
jgi:SnoaL-like domain